MNYLYILNEYLTNGFYIINLNITTIIAIISGIFVITSKNPIVSVLFLISLFLSISIYLMILGINFIGLSYLLVYVGAISILFLFILMLINVRISEIISYTTNNIPLAIFIGVIFYYSIHKALPLNIINLNFSLIKQEINKYFNVFFDFFSVNNINMNINIIEYYNQTLNCVFSLSWDNILVEDSHINTIGNILYTSFPVWILLTSLILLLAMVGTILITIRN